MGRIRITKEAVEAALPGPSDIYLWDTKLKGYGLKVTPGGRRVYFVQYRLGGRKGRTRRVTIGKPCWAQSRPAAIQLHSATT
jgi:hypothetical protein